MPRNHSHRLTTLEAQKAQIAAAAGVVIDVPQPGRRDFRELLLDLLAMKLEASAQVATTARALLTSPAWDARHSPADLEALGCYLDESALRLGDRLAAPPTGGNHEA